MHLLIPITRIYLTITNSLMRYGMPLMALLFRLWIARIFLYSGLTKLSSWEATAFLFEFEYNIPQPFVEIAAISSTFIELVCPILLILGLATRFAAIPLLIMTAFIQFTYFDLVEHYYWAMLLGTLLCYGAGPISADYFIKTYFSKK